VSALAFFLLGVPAALIADRLIYRLSQPEDELEDEALAAKRLPWQHGAWPARIRLAMVAPVPVLMAIAGWRFDVTQALAIAPLIVALLVCTATDLLRYRVPNAVTYPGTAIALTAALLMPDADVVSALLAASLGGGFFLALALISRGGIGLGDVKLAVLIGAALGLPLAYQALLVGMLIAGAVLGVLFLIGVLGRRQAVPYAPFLALSALAFILVEGAVFAPL
jgi:prepilin signal peptidase PulO-like enzyme (type II secretory pathway)